MNIKEKLNLNNPQFVVLLIAVALSIYGIVETILHIDAAVPTSKTMFICLSYLVILYYALFGYKVPHGNSLKYIILFFAFMLLNELSLEAGGKYPGLPQDSMLLSVMLTGICIIVVSYLSGRLGRFNKSIFLFTTVLVLLLVRVFLMTNYRTIMFANMSDVIIWFDINMAYVLRYKQHKEAGLES